MMEENFQMFYLGMTPHGQGNFDPPQYDCNRVDGSQNETRRPWGEFQDQSQLSQVDPDEHADKHVLEMTRSNIATESNNSGQEHVQNASWTFADESINSISSNSLLKLGSQINFQDDTNKVELDLGQQENRSGPKEKNRTFCHSEKETDMPESSINNHTLNSIEYPLKYQSENKTVTIIDKFTKDESQTSRGEQNHTSSETKQISTINQQMLAGNHNDESSDYTSQTSDHKSIEHVEIDGTCHNVTSQARKNQDIKLKSSENCTHSIADESPQGLAADAMVCQKLIATDCEKVAKTSEILKNNVNSEEDLKKAVPSVSKDHMCYFCLLKFDCTDKLEVHEKSHANMKPYRCSFCPRIFRSYEDRNDHEQACRDGEVSTEIKCDQKDVKHFEPICKSRRSRRPKVKKSFKIETENFEVEPDKSEPSKTDDAVSNNRKTRQKLVVKVKEVNRKVLVKKKQKKHKQVMEKQNNASGSHQCPMCPSVFVRNGHLKNHLQKVHSISDGLACKICKNFYTTKEELEKHEPSHVCEICGKICKFVGSMAKHMKQHKNGKLVTKLDDNSEDGKTCKVCNMKFKYNRSAREHEKRHKEPLIHKCMKCPRKFPTEEKLVNHQGICKSNLQQCKQCDKTFKYNYQLHMHVIEAHTGEYYTCEICGQKFSNRGAWRTHEKLHTKEKDFKCSFCGKEFHFKASLEDHMTLHSDKKPYQCMYCGLNVKTKGALKKHEGLHTGAFAFKCEHCELTFNSRLKVNTHTQEKHTGREFICEICGKAFTNSRFLKNHEMIHTGEKPFKCPHCDARFRRRHHVTQHIPRHFKDQQKETKSDYVPMVFQQL